MEPQIDLTKSPGMGVCDRCERILELGWFGFYWLCEPCATHAVTCIGADATGRALERMTEWLEQMKQERERGERNQPRVA